jgi:hypothetical protein
MKVQVHAYVCIAIAFICWFSALGIWGEALHGCEVASAT